MCFGEKLKLTASQIFVYVIFVCGETLNKEKAQQSNMVDYQNDQMTTFQGVSFFFTNSSTLPEAMLRYYGDGSCENDDECKDPLEICVHHYCTCREYYEHRMEKKCLPCPGLGASCEACCSDLSLVCYNKICTCIDGVCQGTQGVFVTASQIALSAALLMGFAALAMVIYRLCTKPRYLTPRHRTAEETMERVSWGRTSALRASLSSIQIRVLARLRDRPPAYENHYRRRQEAAEIAQRNSQIQEPPPPYGEQRDSGVNRPPPYSEIILNPEEFINQAYMETEGHVPGARRTDDPKDTTNSTL